MLPTPADLRDQSRLYREIALKAETGETKRQLAAHALTLAEIAEAIERDEQGLIAEDHKRRLVEALDEGVRLLIERRVSSDTRGQIKRWRMRVEEILTTADQCTVPSLQESLRRAAANYDKLADNAEAQLVGRPSAPSDKAG
jgi:hypothetical protein